MTILVIRVAECAWHSSGKSACISEWDHCIVSAWRTTKHHELIRPHERQGDPRTDDKTSHVPEIPYVATATEKPRHIVRKRDGVRAKAVNGEPTPDGSLSPIHHGRSAGSTYSAAGRRGMWRNRVFS
jgi:hypothetical protein